MRDVAYWTLIHGHAVGLTVKIPDLGSCISAFQECERAVNDLSACRAISRSLIIAACLGLSPFSFQAYATEPIVAELPEGVGNWAVHEETGRVFASLVNGSEVVEYDHSAREVQRFEVGATPTEMILKGDRLVVACTKSPSLHVIDLTSNKSLGAIALLGRGPYGLFCSQVDNGYVYAVSNTGSAWWDGEIFQCDLNTMKVRNKQRVQGWGQSHVLHVAMSRDGKWIVLDARGASSPSGADLMKVDEAEVTFSQIRDYHQSFGQIMAGPLNRYWTFGNALYTLDITKSVREFSGSPVAIHPRLDLAVSKTSNGLALERFTDASLIALVPLPDPPKNMSQIPDRRPGGGPIIAADPTLQFDLKNDLVFLGERTRGSWVDLSQFRDRLAPLMMVQAPSEVASLVGRPLRIPLAVTNGGDHTQLTIARGPQTAKLDDEGFLWEPQTEDVGFTTVRLELKAAADNRTLDTAEITVQVTLPKIDLGFHAKTMELSPNGRYLLAWGPTPGEEGRHPAHTGSDEVAVIDVQQQKMLSHVTLPQGIRCAAIGNEYVYIAPSSGDLFYRLDRSLGERERMFLQSAPTQLITLGDGQLLTVGNQIEYFDTKEMKRIRPSSDVHRAGPLGGIRVLGPDAVQLGSQIIDRSTGNALRVIGFVDLPSLVQAPGLPHRTPSAPNPPSRWGRRLADNALTNHAGGRIAQWPGQRTGVLSERWPMAILIGSTQGPTTTTTRMELANLIDGKVEHTAIVDVSANNRTAIPHFYGERNTLLVFGDQVLILKGTALLLATIPQSVADAMPMPTYFLPQQTHEIEVPDLANIKLAVGGETDGVTFSSLAEYPGVELDRKTGELAINTPELWDSFVKLAVDDRAPWILRASDRPAATLHAESAKQYKELTGKVLPADKLATQLPIAAVLRDAEGQEDGIQFSVIVVGPQKQLADAVAAKQAEKAKRAAEMQEARKKQQDARAQEAASRAAQLQNPVEAGNGIGQRVDALEARMRRIEAVLDSILKRLDEQEQ